MQLPDFLQRTTLGSIRLTGHRIGLEHVVEYFAQGFSAEMILEQFPSLPLAMIYKVIAFYLENRAEVDAYVASHSTPLGAIPSASPDLAELRRRYQRLQQPATVQ